MSRLEKLLTGYGVKEERISDLVKKLNTHYKPKKKQPSKHLYTFFDRLWKKYPNKLNRPIALKRFLATVTTNQKWIDINKALDNYLKFIEGKDPQFIKQGGSWFMSWEDWVNYKKPEILKARRRDDLPLQPWEQEVVNRIKKSRGEK